MSISYSDIQREDRMDIIDAVAGANAYIDIYDDSAARPGNDAAVPGGSVLLATPRGNAGGFAATTTNGVLTADTITSDASADASGTASWFRITASDNTTIVCDGDCGIQGSGADLILDSLTITATQTVSIDTFIITEGNDY
jgi:hypothetical protein